VDAQPLRLDGPILLTPRVHGDPRGFFVETYREARLAELGVRERWVQDNHSRSARAVLRGMHFQLGDGQAKLVRCARGAIFDVVVDVRPASPTLGRWESVELDDENGHSLYIPTGFAHGFCVTSDLADVTYKCSSYYDPAVERGFAYDDPEVGIEWPEPAPVVSERDREAPSFAEAVAGLGSADSAGIAAPAAKSGRA
jgi:dTDP-4-dehydrorhamnose 3,5-epimerase